MLDRIRAEEQERGGFSNVPYIMQLPDIYYLVNNVWHGRSIISENGDVYLLRLARFDVKEDWTPWNCVPLTEDETAAHYEAANTRDLYSEDLLRKIKLTHTTAKRAFRQVGALRTEFRNFSPALHRFRNVFSGD